MKKITHFLSFLLLAAGTAFAQVPMFFNTNVAGGGNAFPLNNSATSRKVQWFIPAGSMGAISAGNNITDVYFQAGSAATRTYPNLVVKLKTGTGTGLTGTASGPVEAGMTTVYSGTNITIISTTGGWIKITLQTPWLYNNTAPLIVELEHNATTGTGPTIYQAVSIPGPGNGRQWADYNVGTITGVGTNQVNFGVDILPATPCAGAPPSNSVAFSSFTTCPGLGNPLLGLAASYSLGGLTYQWNSSTVSPVGPFSPIPNATLSSVPIPTLASTTWFQIVATCTNGSPASTTLNPSEFFVAGTTTNVVPYSESFEGIQVNNRLPNCSWLANGVGTLVNTYVSSNTNNRIPRTGSKFASFSNLIPGTNYMYTNEIYMEPGITYSASTWYQTDLTGANNWSDLSLMIGSAQTPTALTTIASTNGPAISFLYKALSGTFTVPTPGFYHIALKATSGPGAAVYMSIDDINVEIPCTPSLNSPTLTLTSASGTNVCSGISMNFNASGANTYTWSTGSNAAAITITPTSNMQVTVAGSNTLTGCAVTNSLNINVKPSPVVSIINIPTTGCAGKSMTLVATGANNYVWNTGAVGQVAIVTPTGNTSYTVIGTNSQGCSAQSSQLVTVFPNPLVAGNVARNQICLGESEQLTGSGANSYTWTANSIYIVANPVIVTPNTSTTYTVEGKDNNGCVSKDFVNLTVNACTDIKAIETGNGAMSLYPNPNSGIFTVTLSNGLSNTVEVMDVTGKIVATYQEVKTSVNIDLSSFASGIYTVKVSSSKGQGILKMVKE